MIGNPKSRTGVGGWLAIAIALLLAAVIVPAAMAAQPDEAHADPGDTYTIVYDAQGGGVPPQRLKR